MLYIFDMGGVLAYNTDVFPDVFGFLGITSEQFNNLAGKDLERFLNGEVTTDEFWSNFSSRYGKKVKEELFGKFFNPRIDQGVMNIIKKLKNDSRVVCGTNTFDPHYDYLLEGGYYDVFDAVFASNKMGVSKPNPEFYRYILNDESIKAEDALFVDDSEVNVSAAKKLQIRSILFTDSSSLEHHINRLQAFG